MTAHEAVNEVLWQDPPLANLGRTSRAATPSSTVSRCVPGNCSWSPSQPPTPSHCKPLRISRCAPAPTPTSPGRLGRTGARRNSRPC
ncbi:hypothetical protein NKH18_39155 [Streptomyces sp. M10(2022)]